MDVDSYRLAYNVLHRNWIKFGIPEEDIPPPKTETVASLDPIIPGFSSAVVLFLIASRKNLKTFLDEDCPTVHNLDDVCTRFLNTMKEVLSKDTVVKDSPTSEDGVFQEAAVQDSPSSEDTEFQDTLEEYLSDSNLKAVRENFVGLMNKTLPGDPYKEGLLEDNTKGDPTGNTIHPEVIPGMMMYSLAVCTELVLYERENENNKVYMKYIPDLWKIFFDTCLKPICNKACYTQDHLKDYSNSIEVPEEILDKFISENKNEYEYIASKFFDYSAENSEEKSPEHSQLKTKVRSLSIGMSILKLKEKFSAIKKICKCFRKDVKDDKMELLDHSNSSSNSTPTSP